MVRGDSQYGVPLSRQVGVEISSTVKCLVHLTCLIVSTFGRSSKAVYMLPVLLTKQ